MVSVSSIMDTLGDALEEIEGLRVFPYYADRVHPPAVVVGWPDSYAYDSTMARGADTLVFPVTVVVGRADARSSRDQLSLYADGSGSTSVKQAIEELGPWVRVMSAEFGVVSIAGVEYLAATFDVEVVAYGVSPTSS